MLDVRPLAVAHMRTFLSLFAAVTVCALAGPPVLARGSKTESRERAFEMQVTSVARPDRVVVTALGFIPIGQVSKLRRGDNKIVFEVPGFSPMRRGGGLEIRGRDAIALWEHWRRLQPGNGAGCFSPGYLIEMYRGNERITKASVCFHCSNIALGGPGGGIISIGGDGQALERFERYLTKHLAPYDATRDQPSH